MTTRRPKFPATRWNLLCTLRASIVAIATLAPLPLLAGISSPQEAPRATLQGDVIESTGAFTAPIEIKVPPFRGLEPKLALTYSSSSSNGFVGVGWSLSGLSFVERASPGGGAPKYNASDIFLLDGAELIPNCTTFGGTHCPKHQSYQRIAYSAASNEWTVTDRDGSKSTYRSLYGTGGNTFRWAMREEVDTRGNKVTYDYKCTVLDTNCYPDKISYNGAVITFYTDDPLASPRPDPISFATGGSMSFNFQRLRTIGVSVGGVHTRAYALSYRTSVGTQRSLLDRVTMIGRPASISATGAVSGGTADQPLTLTWQENGGTFSKGPVDANNNASGLGPLWNGDEVNIITADFNGDGITDLLRQEKRLADSIPGNASSSPHYNILVYLGNGNGSFTAGPIDATSFNAKGLADGNVDLGYYWSGVWANVFTGDFNGDGKADILRQETSTLGYDGKTNITLYFGNGDGSFTRGPVDYVNTNINDNACGLGHVWGGDGVNVHLGDFNGDGKTDVLRQERAGYATDGAGDAFNIQVFHSQGNGCFTMGPLDSLQNAVGLGHAWDGSRVNIHLGDFNGDGKIDILRQEKEGYANENTLMIGVFLSNGDGTFTWGPHDDNAFQNANGLGYDWNGTTVNVHLADFNGDGKTDILRQEKANIDGVGTIEIYYSLGNATFRRGTLVSGNVPGLGANMDWRGDLVNVHVADFNGDGLADILRQEKEYWGSADAINNIRVYYAKGDGSFWLGSLDSNFNSSGLGADWNGSLANVLVADFNGDGNPDILRQEKGSWATDSSRMIEIYLQPATAPDLVSGVNNGFGGTSTIAYSPSSRWSRTNMPSGSISQTVASITSTDGRGASETTTYSYSGAAWSHTLNRPLGHAFTRTTAADGSFTDSYHLQTNASPGATYHVNEYSRAAALMRSSTKFISENAAPPYTSLVTRVEATENNGNSAAQTFRTTARDMAYDAYGNMYQTNDHGDIGVSGDEKTLNTWHYPNLTAYIVSVPAFVNVYTGITLDSAALVSQTLNHYDDATIYTTPPTRGELTKASAWNNLKGGPSADTSVAYSSSTFSYDSFGNRIRHTDAIGRVTNTTYNDPGATAYPNVYPFQVCQVMAPAPDHCASTKWDVVLGVVTDTTDHNGGVIRAGYDNLGRKISETDAGQGAPGVNVTTWTFNNLTDPNNRYIQKTQPDGTADGIWERNYLDGMNRVWKATREGLTAGVPYQQLTLYSDISERVWKKSDWFTSTPGLYMTHEYDDLGRMTRIVHGDGASVTTTFANDATGKPYSKVVGEMGQERLLWHDVRGNVTKVQEAAGGGVYHTTTFAYDALGRRVKATDALGNVTTASFNSLGLKTSETRAGTGTWSYTYYDDGHVRTQTDAKGQIITLTYDSAGRTKTKVAGGEVSTWLYDEPGYGASIGRVTRVLYPGGNKEFTYNIHGEVTQSKACVGAVCRTLASTKDSLGRVRTLTYPAAGTSPAEVVTYNYSTDGQLKDVSGYVTSMEWTPNGQLAKMKYANGTSNTYTYQTNRGWLNSADSTLDSTGAALYSADYGYDASARVASTSITSNAVSVSDAGVTFVSGTASTQPGVYNLFINGFPTLSSITGDAAAGIIITGSNNTVMVVIGPSSATVTLAGGVYDTAGLANELRTKINTHPTFAAAGLGVTVTYASGKLTVTSTVLGTPGRVDFTGGNGKNNLGFLTYARAGGADLSGQLNGVSAIGLGQTLTGAAGSPAAGLTVKVPAGATGPRGTVSYHLSNLAYTYDPMNRLKTVSGSQTQTFAYNAVGNMTSNSLLGSYTYHPSHKHAVQWAGTRNYDYDANGSMLSSAGGGELARTMTWDAQNRLKSLNRNGVVTDFGYDEDEQRVRKTTGGMPTLYFNKMIERVADIDEHFFYAGTMLVAKKKIEPAASFTRWYHSDRLGSVRLMTRQDGVEVRDYDYKAFGAIESTTGTASNERGFTGHVTDEELGLVYMGARYYDAALGRFISADDMIADPFNPQALNRYSYVYNNPLNNTDPSGNVVIPVAAAAVSAMVGAFIGGVSSALTGADLVEIAINTIVGAGSGGGGAGSLTFFKWTAKRMVKKQLGGDAMEKWKENKLDRIAERASMLLFGASYGGGASGLAYAKGERGMQFFSSFAMGFAGGSFGAFARGLYYKRKFGERLTHGDVIRKVAAKNQGIPVSEVTSTTLRAAFRGTSGGMLASFIVGVLAKTGAYVSRDLLVKGAWGDVVLKIDERISTINMALHYYAIDTGTRCNTKRYGNACFDESDTAQYRAKRAELRAWRKVFEELRRVR